MKRRLHPILSRFRCAILSTPLVWLLFGLASRAVPACAQTNIPSTVLTDPSQAALEAALASGVPIMFGFDGTIALTKSILITTNVTLDASGHQITLDGQNAVRHFVVTKATTLRLINVTVANGRAIGTQGQTNQNGDPVFGGAIYNGGGILELTGCTLTNNQAIGGKGGATAHPGVPPYTRAGDAWGGAIYSANGEIRMNNCLLKGNICQGGFGAPDQLTVGYGGDATGGAICSTNGVISLTAVIFTGNLARTGETNATSSSGSPSGGAIYESGALVASDCVFISNEAFCATNYEGSGLAQGGAIVLASGTAEISRTSFIANKAMGGPTIQVGQLETRASDASGGAISSRATLELRDSAFVLNEASGGLEYGGITFGPGGAGSGGGIASVGTMTIINCTFAQNSATSGAGAVPGTWSGFAYGGAISLSGTNLLVNLTFAGNSVQGRPYPSPFVKPPMGGSSLFLGAGATIGNTVLSCEPGQTNVYLYYSTITDGGHNICSDASAQFTSSTSRNTLDPRLAPSWTYNGGPTPTVALLPDSPAIDAGDDSLCPPTDQRGIPRPQGLHCDIGAFELAPELTLTRAPNRVVTLRYQFQAGATNQVSASTDLINWLSLGTRVCDADGMFRLDDTGASQLPSRFYNVRPQP